MLRSRSSHNNLRTLSRQLKLKHKLKAKATLSLLNRWARSAPAFTRSTVMFTEITELDYYEQLHKRPCNHQFQMHHYEKDTEVLVHANPLAVEHARINGVRAFAPINEPIPMGLFSDLDVIPGKKPFDDCEEEWWLSYPPKSTFPAYPEFRNRELDCGATEHANHCGAPDETNWNHNYLPQQIPDLYKLDPYGGDESCEDGAVDLKDYVKFQDKRNDT